MSASTYDYRDEVATIRRNAAAWRQEAVAVRERAEIEARRLEAWADSDDERAAHIERLCTR